MSSTSKSILAVLGSNIVSMLVGIVGGFLVPRFLGITEYSVFKTYGLYLSFVGLFSLGYVDGIYLKYGGIRKDQVSRGTLQSETWFFVIFQLAAGSLVTILGVLSGQQLVFFIGLTVFAHNMIGFYRLFYQAVGDFRTYSLINAIQPTINLVLIILLIFAFRIRSGIAFVIASVALDYIVFAFLFSRHFSGLSGASGLRFLKQGISHIKIGIFIMVGNLSSTFFYSMDRWFVKVLLKTEDFAFYSFATSMMHMVLILITSVAMTFYPMLARRHQEEALVKTLKSYLLILGAFAGAAYFGFDFVVRWMLTDYIPSLEVIEILFAGFPAIAVINAIYVNMYKAQKVEKKYFFTVFGMMAVSFGLNALAVIIDRSIWTIAAATTIAFYFWFFFSSKDFKGTRTNLREIAYLTGFLIVFFSTTRLFFWWTGLPLYLVGIFGITLLFYKKEFLDLISKIISAFKIRSSAN